MTPAPLPTAPLATPHREQPAGCRPSVSSRTVGAAGQLTYELAVCGLVFGTIAMLGTIGACGALRL